MIDTDLRTIADLPAVAADRYGDRPAWRHRADGGWTDRSFRRVAADVAGVASGLIARGIQPGERVCLLAETSPQWSVAGLAVLAAGAVLVPIYPSSSAQECAWVVSDSGARLVLCDNEHQRAKITGVDTVLLDALPTAAEDATAGRRAGIDVDDPALIIYTSGTTGPAKGCVLTHRNWLALCVLNVELGTITADDTVYLFLPLAHVFAQMVQFASLHAGAVLVYFGGDPRRIVAELAETRPTFLPSVPRIFEKVYTLATAGLDPARLAGAVATGLEVRRLRVAGLAVPTPLDAAFTEAEALFARVRAIFGGRLRHALSGAAPISVDVLEFFHAAGVPVLEGYGMTESSGIGASSTVDRFRLGAVGVAAPGTRLRLADDGEVLMAGPHVFAGYWRNDEATRESIVDGWLRTGDLGALDDDGFLTITGRKKDLIITAGGKNIAPANLENELRQSRWISYAVVYGDRRPYPVALLTLDPEEIVPWARERGLPDDPTALAAHPDVRALLADVVDTVNARHARVAQVKRFAVLPRDLSQSAGELTPTLKVKRSVVYGNHAAVLDALYA